MRIKTYGALLFIAAVAIMSCNNEKHTDTGSATTTTVVSRDTAALPAANATPNADDDYEVMYIAVADTGTDYYKLSNQMYLLSKAYGMPIDTMDRYYNAKKDEIVVSDTDEDEMYRGEYFPRRSTGESLSLEYLRVYSEHTRDKNIALVAGMYSTQKGGDSMRTIIARQAPNSFVVKANVYVGCMH